MLIQPFSELGATNEGQRVDAGQRFARRDSWCVLKPLVSGAWREYQDDDKEEGG
jgi:hypothetical protein